MAYKREDWNQLIRDVNNIITSPPDGCSTLDPLEEVDENHIWSKNDIQVVQNALILTCVEIEFSDMPDKWKQSILDEIDTAMEQAWCHCEPPTCFQFTNLCYGGGWTPDYNRQDVPMAIGWVTECVGSGFRDSSCEGSDACVQLRQPFDGSEWSSCFHPGSIELYTWIHDNIPDLNDIVFGRTCSCTGCAQLRLLPTDDWSLCFLIDGTEYNEWLATHNPENDPYFEQDCECE